jgi:hypothetical protein
LNKTLEISVFVSFVVEPSFFVLFVVRTYVIRYCSASAACSDLISSEFAKSAIVRLTRNTL